MPVRMGVAPLGTFTRDDSSNAKSSDMVHGASSLLVVRIDKDATCCLRADGANALAAWRQADAAKLIEVKNLIVRVEIMKKE